MYVDNTVHYRADPAGHLQFGTLIPESGSIVFVNATDDEPGVSRNPGPPQLSGSYTLALFHQLECISILRSGYSIRLQSYRATKGSAVPVVEGESRQAITPLAEHCLNYLRQSVLCHANTRLESVRYPAPPNVVSLYGDYRCYDWEKVYKGVKDGIIQKQQ